MPKQATPQVFDLHAFFPYLVRVFYIDVKTAVSAAYQSEFDMTPAEWRAMVIIGPDNVLTANEIVDRSSMDKVTVSRAISRMKKNRWVRLKDNKQDGRSKLIRLSKTGRDVYRHLVPKVLEVEQQLLAGISAKEYQQFVQTMEKICENQKSTTCEKR